MSPEVTALRASVAVVLSVAIVGCASTPSATHSSPARPSIAALVDRPLPQGVASDLQTTLDHYVETHHTPSANGALIVPGKGVWAGAAGLADTRKALAATTDTDYAIGSITKTFVAALTLLLVRDGVFQLDDPAGRWLDGRAAAKANGATVRQLLGHLSGIANYTENNAILAPGRIWTPFELLDLVGEPHFTAGERFEYSNTNYLLLGLIVERAGGAPLEAQLRERLLKPYGLNRTFLSGRERVATPLAHGYGRTAPYTGDLYDDSGFLPNAALATGAWAAGDIASTAGDVARWLYKICSGAVVGADLQEQMLPRPGSESYGLGIDQHSFPGVGMVSGHVGAIPGYVALGFFQRESCVVAVVLTNTDVDDLDQAMEGMFSVVAKFQS
jgi:D-alanyl-D-alanine carboxypeptidase